MFDTDQLNAHLESGFRNLLLREFSLAIFQGHLGKEASS